jgi:hypothetical protein|nr:MAG TPA: hypothetical protein [Caudoviricetes sp.]
MINFKVTGVDIQADVNQDDFTSVILHTLVTSDKKRGSAEELEQIARAVGTLCHTDLEPGYEVNRAPLGHTVEEVNSTISYAESAVYDSVMLELKNAALKGVAPIQAIKNLGGIESEGVLLAVRDWLNEVTQ